MAVDTKCYKILGKKQVDYSTLVEVPKDWSKEQVKEYIAAAENGASGKPAPSNNNRQLRNKERPRTAIADGSIQMRTGTGSVAEIRMYCESSNAHYQTLKAQPHASGSSAVLTLPTATGTLVGTGDTSSVSHSMLGASFKTIVALSGTSVDWSAGQVFTKTLSGDTTLTFTGVSTGMQINLVIDGNYTLTLPTSVKELNGASTYDGSGEHLISIVSTNGSTEQFATINKIAS